MQRKTILWWIFLLTLLSSITVASAITNDEPYDLIEEQVDSLDLTNLNQELQQLSSKYDVVEPRIDLQTVLKMLKGEESFSFPAILQNGLRYFLRELLIHLDILVKIMILGVLAVLIQKLQGAFGGHIGEIAYLLAYLVIMIFIVQSFGSAISLAKVAIEDMLNFMIAILPLLLVLLASLGNVVSVALFDPLLVVGCQTVANIVSFTVLPLFYASGILILVDNLSSSIKISNLSRLVRGAGAVILGSVFTLFAGFTIMRGTAGAVADGVAMRTGKYVTKAFLPVVGGMVSDAFETVLGASLILKNSLGVLGLILVFFLCALPALKIVAIIFMYKVAAACIQPLGEERLPQVLSAISTLMSYVLAAVVTIGVMLFLVITVVVLSGNATVMMR